MEAVGHFVEKARNRSFIQVLLEGDIRTAGRDFHLGQSELALVEVTMQRLEAGESTLIHTQFPSDSIPLALTASYAYAQRPALGGQAKALILFPSTGYVTRLDEFHHGTTLNYNSSAVDSLIKREVVHKLSEVPDDWGVYSAPTNGSFQLDVPPDEVDHLDAMLVDLRRPEWSERMFNAIWTFIEEADDLTVVFYARDMDAAAMVDNRLDTEPLEITNSLLATADPTEARSEDTDRDAKSDLTVQERILSNGGVNVTCVPVVDEDFGGMVPNFIQMKNDLQERNVATIAVGRVFNMLTKQPFKPKYWNERARGDGYYNDVDTYIDILQDKSDNADGVVGDTLSNYARQAADVQSYLNDTHRVQNTVFNAMQNAAEDDQEVVFVVGNTAERDALIEAATSEGYRIPDNTRLTKIGTINPDLDARYVFLSPPSFRNQYVYEFPPSKEVAFVHHAMWTNYVERTSKRALEDISSTHNARPVGGNGSPGEIDDFVFDIDDLEDELERQLESNPMSLISPDIGADDDKDGETGTSTDDAEIRLHLSDGDHIDATPRQHITVYDEETASINKTVASALSVGDQILRIGDAAEDIYDVLVDSVDSREAMRKHFETLSEWREMVDSEMNERGLTNDDVVEMLRKRGSDLAEDSNAVKRWRTGERYGPGDSEDLRRTIQIFRPQVEEAVLDQVHRVVWNSLKTIRDEHRRIGRDARRILAAEVNPSTSATVKGNVNEQLIKNKAQNLKKVDITEIESLNDDD